MVLSTGKLLPKIIGIFLLGFGLMIFVYILEYRASEDVIRSFRRVEKMQTILLKLVDAASLMKDVQRSHRGFVLTEKEEFLKPYYQATKNLPVLVRELKQELRSHATQQQDFLHMQHLIAAKIAYADSAIMQVKQGGASQSVQEIERGKQLFDSLSLVQQRMIEREQGHLALIRQEAENNSNRNRIILFVAFLVSATLLLLALWRILRNVSNIKKLQLQLEEANYELSAYNEELITTNQALSENEHKLYATNLQLESSHKNLEKISAELGTFSYTISHDLRAPLRAISGYSTIIKEEYGDKLGEEGVALVEIIRLNANRLGALIHDLLNFSKLGEKAVHKQSYDMQLLIRKVLAEAVIPEGTRIHLPAMEPAMIDPSLFRQVWENLISNALKFSSKEKQVEILFSYSRENDRQLFCITDNGIGFDPDYAQDLFLVFKRLHTDAAFEGTGAGLAIARRIVEGHGGEIWAHARLGEGATFCFSLPVEN